ncbi:uncharacterized protein [Aphelocoma coerulescens]|uniref:uncharacterized protein n=1 Tax=Aphelocoma coerulescens TaxID=39617 RepID=UPI0036054356
MAAPQRPSSPAVTTAVAAAAAAAAVLTSGQQRQDCGGSESGGTGRGRGSMALALRLVLLLLLAVALPARAAQAAPMPARGAAEPLGEAASQPMSTTEPQGEDEGVSAGRTSPAPLLVPACKPGSHRRGPPKGMNKATELKKPHEPLRIMRQMLKEMLQGGQEMEAEAVLKAAFPGGSSGSLAASAAGREAMPGTGTGDWDQDMDYLESLLDDGLKTLAHAGG